MFNIVLYILLYEYCNIIHYSIIQQNVIQYVLYCIILEYKCIMLSITVLFCFIISDKTDRIV